MLTDLHLHEEYFTGDKNLVESFYRPCLSEAIEYHRSVGYFRSSVFILIGPDVINFVKRGGKIRLVSSPYLTEDDINAINAGYKNKIDSACNAVCRDVDFLLSNQVRCKKHRSISHANIIGCNGCKTRFFA